jgi:polyhydroxybutyrate depolymerase
MAMRRLSRQHNLSMRSFSWTEPPDFSLSVRSGGLTRTCLVHVPARAGQGPLPVVINYHGGGSNAAQLRGYSRMNLTADRHGFAVVYPNGTGVVPGQRLLLTFNAGRCCPPASLADVDDVGCTEAMIALLAERISVDSRRIYATGMSNGGMMAHRLAADSDLVASIAPVAGQLNVTTFAPRRAVPVMAFHSVDDIRAPYGGGRSRVIDPGSGGDGAGSPRRPRYRGVFPPVEDGIRRWAAHDGCPAEPVIGSVVTGARGSVNEGQTVTRIRYGPGRDGSEVVLFRLTGAGHVWPGSPVALPRLLGRPTTLIDANEEMWRFFAAHPKP